MAAKYAASVAFDLYALETDVHKDPLLAKARDILTSELDMGERITSVINLGLGIFNSVPTYTRRLYDLKNIDCREEQPSRALTDRAARSSRGPAHQRTQRRNPYTQMLESGRGGGTFPSSIRGRGRGRAGRGRGFGGR